MTDEQEPVAGRPGRGPRRARSDAHFRRAMAFTVAGTLIPGLGLIAAKRRVAGVIVLAVFLGALVALAGGRSPILRRSPRWRSGRRC